MKYLLDTNTCICAIKRSKDVVERLQGLSPDDVSTSAVTFAELCFGARKSSKPQRARAAVEAFLAPIGVIPFDRDAAECYAVARHHLESRGTPIGERDLLIASVALSRSLIVVTHNVREFARVPDLKHEDWKQQ